MKPILVTPIITLSFLVSGCSHKTELTFHVDSLSFTQGSAPISNEEARNYLEAPQNSDSLITVIDSGGEPVVMKVSEFSKEADRVAEAINAFYFPEKSVFDESVFKDADAHTPFDPFELKPIGSRE